MTWGARWTSRRRLRSLPGPPSVAPRDNH